jgi:hypothetical protein
MRQRFDIFENSAFGLSPENPKDWRLEHFKGRTPHLKYLPSGKVLPMKESRGSAIPLVLLTILTFIVAWSLR